MNKNRDFVIKLIFRRVSGSLPYLCLHKLNTTRQYSVHTKEDPYKWERFEVQKTHEPVTK